MAVKTASLTALIITLAGVKAIVLTQQKTQTSKLGQNVQIQCTKDNSGWTLSWYQQTPGSAPKFLLADGTRASGLPSSYFGGGTKLTVADAHPPTPPELVLLAPSQDLSSGDRATVVCLAQGFYPDGATLTWSEEGKAVAGTDFQTGESKRQSDGTFSLSSVLTVQPERWRSGHTYTCQLSHSALSSPLTKSVAHGQCS
ncbi:hypothetical protein AALO_G00245850 [Alosa alosa]|uniref:Ig-like domain-containing protein n=1 Tax=Alosa alosa TaxID=278164 RepID=A0AAV6FSF5_9TELE|nr:hypothetical protein AALO_G00245850 [Alosa alosa]